MRLSDGKLAQCDFDVTNVSKPIVAVAALCDKGNAVVFDSAGSYILNKRTRETTALKRRGNGYFMDFVIEPERSQDKRNLMAPVMDDAAFERWMQPFDQDAEEEAEQAVDYGDDQPLQDLAAGPPVAMELPVPVKPTDPAIISEHNLTH